MQFSRWLGISSPPCGGFDWQERYGQVNEHNAWIPRDLWLEGWEKKAILDFYREHPLEGYRRLTFMMLDAGVVAVSPSSVYRVLKEAGVLRRWNVKPSRKGKGFQQPLRPHEHWHVDPTYIPICGTYYHLCPVLDGCSRYVVQWDIGLRMTEADVEIILQRARERFPGAHPRVISDNGPQFVAKDFKEFIRLSGMTHVKTSPYYPQSNGKVERWQKTLKGESLRPRTPLSLEDARRVVTEFVRHYNEVRLHPPTADHRIRDAQGPTGRTAGGNLQGKGPQTPGSPRKEESPSRSTPRRGLGEPGASPSPNRYNRAAGGNPP